MLAAMAHGVPGLVLASCVAAAGAGKHGKHDVAATCPGEFPMPGYGKVSVIPTGWGTLGAATVQVNGTTLWTEYNARAYFADECTAGKYDNKQYMAVNLLKKTIKFTTDLSGAKCGCNIAFYLTNMYQNKNPSDCGDHYCDANNVCGQSCAEIDIMEANMYAWHSTLHTRFDHSGMGGGYGGGDGWIGARDWASWQYGPGASCIDTWKPFEVAVSFPVDWQGQLAAMEVTLTQKGKNCPLSVRLGSYGGMADLSFALQAGMTPIFSYWGSDKMLWMDGMGPDQKGPCAVDLPGECPAKIKFSNFVLEGGGTTTPAPTTKAPVDHEPLKGTCPGSFDMTGHGPVALVPTGWGSKDASEAEVRGSSTIVPHMGARAYFAQECTAGEYSNKQYLALNLLGKKLTYTANLAGAGCGCNAAFYLVSMRQNKWPSHCNDYYCDANSVCAVSCSEIDIQEGNMHSWHSTLHTQYDHSGLGAGYGGGNGWKGPRDWTREQYGPGGMYIDTNKPFHVAVAFPVDTQGVLTAMEVTLTQDGKPGPLSLNVAGYEGNKELSEALAEGMTPVISYWSSADMLWMDGKGDDFQGPCATDDPSACAESVTFSNFSVHIMPSMMGRLKRNNLFKTKCVDGWALPKKCVTDFTFQGKSIKGCTTMEDKGRGWCSHDAVYDGSWSYCSQCDERGMYQDQIEQRDQSLSGETKEPSPNDKSAKEMSRLYQKCGGNGWDGPTTCEPGTACQFVNKWWSQCAPYEGNTDECLEGWRMADGCISGFVYDDQQYVGCTTADSDSGAAWCSLNVKYSGHWRHCARCGGDTEPEGDGKTGGGTPALPPGDYPLSDARPIMWATHPRWCVGVYQESKVQLWRCIGSPKQLFFEDVATGTVRWGPNPSLCLTITERTYFSGAMLEMSKCTEGDGNQAFTLPGRHGQPISLRSQPWLCMDVKYGDPSPGTAVFMYWCHPWNENQKFVLGKQYIAEGAKGGHSVVFTQKSEAEPDLAPAFSSSLSARAGVASAAASAMVAGAALLVAVRSRRAAQPEIYDRLARPLDERPAP